MNTPKLTVREALFKEMEFLGITTATFDQALAEALEMEPFKALQFKLHRDARWCLEWRYCKFIMRLTRWMAGRIVEGGKLQWYLDSKENDENS